MRDALWWVVKALRENNLRSRVVVLKGEPVERVQRDIEHAGAILGAQIAEHMYHDDQINITHENHGTTYDLDIVWMPRAQLEAILHQAEAFKAAPPFARAVDLAADAKRRTDDFRHELVPSPKEPDMSKGRNAILDSLSSDQTRRLK
jgi:hypothetical protein